MKLLRGLLAAAYPFGIFALLHGLEPRWGALPLLLVPALINLGLLVTFGLTLRRGPSLVEKLARLQDPHLSEAQVRHCRLFTAVWCVFFALNAVACSVLAVAGDVWLWTLYTGVVSYVLMGCLFAAEFLVRSWRFQVSP